jgi:hypothetical protein
LNRQSLQSTTLCSTELWLKIPYLPNH